MTIAVDHTAYTFVDRTGWAEGPWDDEPDKVQWTDPVTGLPCLIVRHGYMGHLCGYVGVPPGHRYHGVMWSDLPNDSPTWNVNYSAFCQHGDEHDSVCHVPDPGEPDDVWWFGFDCGHYNERQPGMEAALDSLGSPLAHDSWLTAREYRTVDYVMKRCAELAAWAIVSA